MAKPHKSRRDAKFRWEVANPQVHCETQNVVAAPKVRGDMRNFAAERSRSVRDGTQSSLRNSKGLCGPKLPAHSKVLGETKQLFRKALAAKLRSSALGPGRHRPARGPEAALRGSYRACPDRGCLPASSTNYRGWQAASSGLQWPRLCGSLPAAAGAATRAAARTAAAAAAASSSSSSSHGRQAA